MRCNGKSHCAKPDEIEEFINDIQIDIWTIGYRMDFNNYNDPPTFMTMTLQFSDYFRHDEILNV